MLMTKENLLKLATVRTEVVKLECLKNTNMKDMEFQLIEMTIAQNKEYNEILKTGADASFDKCRDYACNAVMVEPSFFTEEELKTTNGFGKAIIDEIFMKIPTIGMSAKEKKEYTKKVEEFAKKQVPEQTKEEKEEKEEKKQ